MPHAASNATGKYPPLAKPFAPVDPSPPDRDVLDAVITIAALVARADGWVAESERDTLYRFVVDMWLEPEPSRAEIVDMFERRIRELRAPGDAIVLERLLASAGDWGQIVNVGERVAHADGLLDPRERHILQAIKTIMMATKRAETWRSEADAPKH